MEASHFTSRLPADATEHRQAIETACGVVNRFTERVKEIQADQRFTPQGRAEEIAKVRAGGFDSHLAQLRASADRELAGIEAEKGRMVPPVPDKADVTGEMQRAEIRAWLRGLSVGERAQVALGDDPAIRDAVLNAPGVLSGLTPDVTTKVRAAYVEKTFGARLAELAPLEERASLLQAVCQVAADEIRRAAERA